MRQPGAGNYGLGWSINQNWNGRTVIWHSGGMPGVATTLWVVPSERIAIALVANKSGVPVNQIAAEFLAEILDMPVPASPPGGPRASATDARGAAPLAGRWRGTLSDCAGGDAVAIDIQSGDAAALTVNGGGARPMHSVEASKDRFASSGRATDDQISYQFDLRLDGSTLTGVVRRTTSLGTRGSNSVTLPIVLTRP